MKTYCFDIDGTICEQVCGDYKLAKPFDFAIEEVNRLYTEGNHILIFSARGASSGIDWTETTKNQLDSWGLKYHELIMNKKPSFDIMIDDKAISAMVWRNGISKKHERGVLAGAFDIIHPGYVRMFSDAKKHCQHLTVLLHDNPSIERNKMSQVHSVEERTEILLSMKNVDMVKVYSTEKQLTDVLVQDTYDVRFLGEDYRNVAYTAKELDIHIVFINRNHGYSTTDTKKKIYTTYKNFYMKEDYE